MAFYKITNLDELVDVLEFKTENNVKDYVKKHIGYSYQKVNPKTAEKLRKEVAERREAKREGKLSDILRRSNPEKRNW
ncbi:MAG TPA: hypothetical protein VMC80_01135 [Patescibacteria group bacterium]|nr:hypothetical protein [Patescibacteria group bacterium]